MNKVASAELAVFRAGVWEYYAAHGRAMPWREDTRPYSILVSELMLQQTQVARVIPKFEAFIVAFPSIQSLAQAPLSRVLEQWIGLGYNRRARFLHLAAQAIVQQYGGQVPSERKQLEALPGIGPNTAGAILTYAFNQPVLFIETNIRTVYLHHFFAEEQAVDDKDILALLELTIDVQQPREWYWALMDYGTYLKTTGANNLARSKHYKKQTAFVGSLRQMRGAIVRQLRTGPLRQNELKREVAGDERFEPALSGLLRDGLVEQHDLCFYLTGHSGVR